MGNFANTLLPADAVNQDKTLIGTRNKNILNFKRWKIQNQNTNTTYILGGGFYNEQYFKIHQKQRGDFWFDTAEARQQFIDELKAIEEKLNARHLAMTLSEGYCCRTNTVLHRVIEWEGNAIIQNTIWE